jgi:hypothetical protein
MQTLTDAMRKILEIFPDAILDEMGGEIIILTGMKTTGKNEELVPTEI